LEKLDFAIKEMKNFLLLINMVRNANSTFFQNNVISAQVIPITVSQVEQVIPITAFVALARFNVNVDIEI
jgi:hypothetical protein